MANDPTLRCNELDPLLTALLVNEIDDADRATVEVHLTECAHCREAFEARRGVVELLGQGEATVLGLGTSRQDALLAAAQRPVSHGPRLARFWAPAAAVVVVAAGIVAMQTWDMGSRSEPEVGRYEEVIVPDVNGANTGDPEQATKETPWNRDFSVGSITSSYGGISETRGDSASVPSRQQDAPSHATPAAAQPSAKTESLDLQTHGARGHQPIDSLGVTDAFGTGGGPSGAFGHREIRRGRSSRARGRGAGTGGGGRGSVNLDPAVPLHRERQSDRSVDEANRVAAMTSFGLSTLDHRGARPPASSAPTSPSTVEGDTGQGSSTTTIEGFDRFSFEASGLDLADILSVAPPPPIDAEVLAVRPDADIVVLSVGVQDSVREGQEFTLFRDDRFLAKVKIIQTTDDMAGGRILYSEPNATIAVGDKASTRLSAGTSSTPSPVDTAAAREAQVHRIMESLRQHEGETPDMMFFRYWGDNPFVLAVRDPKSTFGLDVDTASYTLMRNYLNRGILPPKEAVRTEEFVNYFPSHYVAPTQTDLALHLEMAPSAFSSRPNVHLLKVGVKAREVAADERKPTALTLVLDVSGSMNRENRLQLVKETIRHLLPSLTAEDRIGVITFNSAAQAVLEPIEADRIDTIMAALDPLAPGGSTNVQHGLELGYAMAERVFSNERNNRVVLLSDGVANTGLTDATSILGRIEEARSRGIFLNTLGVGMGNHNDTLLEQLADKGDGQCAYIDTLTEAKRLFEDLTGLFETVAKDAKVQVVFDPDVVIAYRQIGYENRAIADVDFRNDKIDAGEVGAGHEVVALYEVELKSGSSGSPAKAFLRYLSLDQGEVVELEADAKQSQVTRFENASPRFRLSACVAAFADVLRSSYWARETRFSTVIELAEELRVLDQGEDTRVAEFLGLLRQAESLVAARQPTEMTRVVDALKRNHYLRARLEEITAKETQKELELLERQNQELESRIRKILGG